MRTGIISTSAKTRGSTRKSKGLKPKVFRASISSLAFMLPMCAAKAAPVRPLMMMAVIITPISRTMAIPTRSATYRLAPKLSSCTFPTNARIIPTRKLISATIGSALIPHCCTVAQKSSERKRALPVTKRTVAWTVSPTNSRISLTASQMAAERFPNRRNPCGGSATAFASLRSGTLSASSISPRTLSGKPSSSGSSTSVWRKRLNK